jgi:hypothetical protein
MALYAGSLAAGRKADAINILAGAGAFTLLIDPYSLASLSFQLSFAAVLAILLLHPRLAVPARNRWIKGVADSGSVTLACTLATTPLSAGTFGVVSPLTVPANLLLAPLSTIAILLGFAVLALGGVPGLGAVVVWLAERCIDLFGGLGVLTAAVPLSHLRLVPPGPEWVVLFYLGLCVWIAATPRRGASRWALAVLPLWLLLLATPHFLRRQPDRVVVLRVEGGVAAVVHRGGRVAVLADSRGLGQLPLHGYLRSEGIDRIDILAPTPPFPRDSLPFEAELILTPGGYRAGDKVRLGGWEIRILSPPESRRWGRTVEGPAGISWRENGRSVALVGEAGATIESIFKADGMGADMLIRAVEGPVVVPLPR